MKLKKIGLISMIFFFLSSGCSNNIPADTDNIGTSENPEHSTVSEVVKSESGLTDGFSFAYNGTAIYLDEYTERIISELETASDYYEVESCTFDGTAKLYSYKGFDISTYQKGGEDKDRIYSIDFTDDSVSTPEGVSVGQNFDEMTTAYGKDYKEIEGLKGFYQYIKNGTVLSFHFQNDVIISVSYKVSDIYAE
jgi:hypothetical protein